MYQCIWHGKVKQIPKIRIDWKWVGGSRSHSDLCVCAYVRACARVRACVCVCVCVKSSQNSPKPVLSSIGCVLCLYIHVHCWKLLVIMIWVFCPCQWWVSKKSLDGVGGWVGWALSGFIWTYFYFAPWCINTLLFWRCLTRICCSHPMLSDCHWRPYQAFNG